MIKAMIRGCVAICQCFAKLEMHAGIYQTMQAPPPQPPCTQNLTHLILGVNGENLVQRYI